MELRPAETGFCKLAQPILWADADTDQTIAQVKAHNAVYVALCRAGVTLTPDAPSGDAPH